VEQIKISVIVPSFNQGKYISSVIKSVIGQSYSNWELIIQDGNSGDDTSEVCNRYIADSRIKFYSEPDKGFADGVNKALIKATGKLCVIQSSDDFFSSPYVFEDVVSIFNDDSRLNLICGSAVVVDEDLNHLSTSERVTGYTQPEFVYDLKNSFSQSATFFLLEKALEIGMLDTKVDMVADTDFWIRLCCYDKPRPNSIYQTSKIWGGVLIQANQRSADFSKFVLGRAKMFLQFVGDNRIKYAIPFKSSVALNFIHYGIKHFEANNLNPTPFYSLYKELTGNVYSMPKISFEKLNRLLRSERKALRFPNSIQDVYFNKSSKSTFYNYGWFKDEVKAK